MKKLVVVAAAVMSLSLTTVFAKEAAKKGAHAEMSEEEMMKKWQEIGALSQEHKDLAKSVGKWNATVTMWMAPGAPPMESKGSAEFRPILGGRFIVQDFTGDFMGQEFHGMGMAGYDKFKKLYVASWQDDMSTALYTMTGKKTAKGVEYMGLMDEPMTGEKNKKSKSMVRWENDDTMYYEMYDKAKGKEWMAMQIKYTRKK